jgi:hypothetical protein
VDISSTVNPLRVLMAGESYWKVKLSTRVRLLSELDTVSIQQSDKRWLIRRYEWLEDLIGSGDIGRVEDVILITPKESIGLIVKEPYTVFQFSRGTQSLLTGERIKQVQVIGVVTDKETGACEYALWDVTMQKLYHGTTSVHNFAAWRPGVLPIGALNLKALDLRGIGG